MSFSSNPAILVNQLPISVDFPNEINALSDTLYLIYRRIANAVNTREGSIYDLKELYNFNGYFVPGTPNSFRTVYRYVYDMVAQNGGPITAGTTVAVAHNIPPPATIANLNGTHIFGSATNSDVTPKRMPLPYSSATLITNNVEIYFNDTDVVLINGSTQSTLTYATVVLEYVKN